MKNKIAALSFVLFGFLGTSNLFAQEVLTKVDTSIFPKAEKGFVQYVIDVPYSSMEDNSNKKIEISVGKNAKVDKCNRHFLSGELQSQELKGWGYNYYTFKTNGNIGGTLMACNETGTVDKFVSAQPFLTDYNGKMPIVIYAPEGYDVQYKIFKAEPENYRAFQVKQK